jgi:(1->4)-alpha-D-glucan 1-alpha-D-glucosylmutase
VLAHAFDTPHFMQTAGPTRAKGLEDTALYRSARMLATREVGSDLASDFVDESADHFHDYCSRIAADWPATMTTLSTHDTKRSEDVRARLVTLLDLGEIWAAQFRTWQERQQADRLPLWREYFLFQTLVAAWPIAEERVQAYFEKADREAKLETTWTEPDEEFEQEVHDRIAAIYADKGLTADIGRFVDEHLRGPALTVSLAQKLVQLTMPGVPDIYQGCELEDYSLVDPDNRRPVDYEQRRDALAELTDPKLRVTATAVRLRRERPGLVGASYQPLVSGGGSAHHVLGFLRGDDIATVVTRFPAELARRGGWGDTTIELPGDGWTDRLTGRAVTSNRLADLFAELPVALLTR